MAITPADLDNWFSYHPPKDSEQVKAYERIRDAGYAFAEVLLAETPPGPDQSAAIRKVREAVMVANAAVACAPEPVDPRGPSN